MVVRLQYAVRYGGSTWIVSHTYGKNMVKVQSSTVKVQYCTETFFGAYCMYLLTHEQSAQNNSSEDL